MLVCRKNVVPFRFTRRYFCFGETQIYLIFRSLIRTFSLHEKELSFNNKNKKTLFCFVLCSLIRTFAPSKG